MSAIGSAIGASAILGSLVYVFKESLKEYIMRGIQHQYDERLAAVQSEFRQVEAALTSQLKIAETQISSLQSGALSAVSARQAALDTRRFQAVNDLWSTVVELGSVRRAMWFLPHFKIDEVIRESKNSKPVRDMFANLKVPAEKLKPLTDARRLQPFVSQTAWNLYAAYSATLAYGQAVATIISFGIGDPTHVKDEPVLVAMKFALPDYIAYIDKYGIGACFHLLDQIEANLVVEVQRWLEDAVTDDLTLKRSAAVARIVANAASVPASEQVPQPAQESLKSAHLTTPFPESN